VSVREWLLVTSRVTITNAHAPVEQSPVVVIVPVIVSPGFSRQRW
jgi:hypothetical protein